MTKAINKITNQYFLFGDVHEQEIDNWFSGCLIQEWDTDSASKASFKELEEMTRMALFVSDKKYAKVTCVVGNKPHGLMLAKVSGSYPLICMLGTSSKHKLLVKLNRAIFQLFKLVNSVKSFSQISNAMDWELQMIPKGTNGQHKQLAMAANAALNAYLSETKDKISLIFTNNFVI
jgi:hypothetical protein